MLVPGVIVDVSVAASSGAVLIVVYRWVPATALRQLDAAVGDIITLDVTNVLR
jgi:hypothetical protein